MPTAPRGAIMSAPQHFAFPNLVPPARIIPPDFELWPEIRMGGHLVSLDLVGLDLRTITLPVTPTIPPTVASGDLITAAHENAVRQALQDLWIDVQALAASSISDPTTAKGQILVRGATAVEALPVGINGQVLVADSTQTQGLRWAPASHGQTPWTQNIDGGGFMLSNAVLSAGIRGAAQTPWLSDIDGANHVLSSVARIGIGISPEYAFQVHLGTDLNFALQSSGGKAELVSINDARNVLKPLGFNASTFTFITGNVGIGANPDITLHVAGKALARDGYFAIQGDYSLVNGAPFYGLGKSTVDVSEGAGAVAVQLAGWGGIHLCSQGGQMVMTRTGKVGIGMPNPAAKCAVFAGADGSDGIHVHGANSAGFLYLAMNNATGAASIGVWTGSAHGNVVIAPAGGSILMWLGGGLKTLSVDGSGFVKAT